MSTVDRGCDVNDSKGLSADVREVLTRVPTATPLVAIAISLARVNRSFPAQGLGGPGVHRPGDAVEVELGELTEVGSPGRELAQATVGVLVRARTRGMGIAEPDVDLQAAGKFGAAGQLDAPVMGKTPA